jgi:hypothetical protein
MKINKNSWHYRLVRWGMEADFYSKLRCCSFDDTMMSHTSCAYFTKLLEAIAFILLLLFLAGIFLGVVAVAVWLVIEAPLFVGCCLLAILASCAILFIIMIVYSLIAEFVYEPIKNWLGKFCKKVEYA